MFKLNTYIKNYFIWAMIFISLQLLLITTYWNPYNEACKKISKYKYTIRNDSNVFKINVILYGIAYWIVAYLAYHCYIIHNDSIIYTVIFITMIYSFWDTFPIAQTQIGYKYWAIWYTDTIISGTFGTLLTCLIFQNIRNKSIYYFPILFLFLCISYFIFWYKWFKIDTINNFVTEIGDKLKLNKILDIVNIDFFLFPFLDN